MVRANPGRGRFPFFPEGVIISSMNRTTLIPVFLLCAAAFAFAQDIIDTAVAGTVMEGTEKVARKLISASFVPFTNYSRGDLLAGGALGYTVIDRMWTDPEVTGENLTGISLGGGAGYALTDRLAVYAIGDALLVNGTLGASFYSDLAGDTPGRLNFYMAHIFAGAGFDLVGRGPFSLPLFLGLHCSASSFRAVLEREDLTTPVPGTAEAEITGGGLTPGVSGGVAGEARIGRMTLSGYALFMADFSGISGESAVEVSSLSYTQSFTSDPFSGSTYGLAMKFSPDKRWTLGLDFSDFLPFGETGEGGVQMSTLAFTVGYRAY